ncbi:MULTISPECIES: helix-turn-helix domain-containing protein [Metallosphaera]|nr:MULTISPECIES: helix-turn-helix domain-containing protein [Metallosphaera]
MDGHVVKSLGRSFDHSDNGLRALVVVSSSSMKTLKSLMDEGKIKDIVNVQRYSDKFIVDIVQEYNNSVLSILNNNGAIVLDTVKANRREYWTFVTYEYKVPMIVKELNKIGVVEKIKLSDYDGSTREIGLTESEIKYVIAAAKAGYFDYPRKVRAKDLAESLGVKESTFLYHLRNAQKKLINKLLRDLDIREQII